MTKNINPNSRIRLLTLILCFLFFSACALERGESGQPAESPATVSTVGAETGSDKVESSPADAHGTEESTGVDESADADMGGTATAVTKAYDASKHAGRYCYETLNEDEKVWYEDIYAVLAGMYTEQDLDEAGIATVGEEGIDKIFQCVMNDHPELFFVKGYTYTMYTYGSTIARISFSGTYTMDAEERDRRQKLIDAAVEECLSHISADASEYTKVKYVYDYLILNTEYDREAQDNQNICSVFIGRKSVCQGYAKATQYLLEKLGIQSTLVIGKVYSGESHAWNLVKIDGAWYYLDTTWGDASYRAAESGSNISAGSMPSVNYDYLCVTTDQLLKTHTIENIVPVPECVSMEANYYVKEGAYFTAYNEADVAAFFEKGYEAGRTDITLKCADAKVYNAFLEQLITNQKIFDFMNSADGVIAYAEDTDKLSLTFWLVNE